MKLTYTVEIELGNVGAMGKSVKGKAAAEVSPEIIEAALDFPGKRIAGYRVDYITVWPHDKVAKGYKSTGQGVPALEGDECPTCGVPKFERGAGDE